MTTGIRTGSARRIMINTVTTVTSDTEIEDHDSGDASDASHPISSGIVKDVKKLVRLTANTQGKCKMCEVTGRMDWEATKHDGKWSLLCSDCGFELQRKLREEKIESFFSNQQAQGG